MRLTKFQVHVHIQVYASMPRVPGYPWGTRVINYPGKFSAFNARHIMSAWRNNMHPETVEALAVVLEGYKNNII